MDSSSANQWLAELEKEELEELDFVDPLSMEQLAESLAAELLWQQPPDQRHRHASSPTNFSFLNDAGGGVQATVVDAAGSDRSMFSLTDGSLDSSSALQQQYAAAVGRSCPPPSEKNRGGGRAAAAEEHVVAERRRRERLHQQFAALASLVPDIAKTDKVSVLGSAIEYVERLRGRVAALQEEQRRGAGCQPPEELAVRCCIGFAGDVEDGDASSSGSPSTTITAEVRGTTLLLTVACPEKKGALIMVLTELERHGLSIATTNVLPFASDSSSSSPLLNITITAQIEDGSSTVVELVKNLHLALRNF